MPIFHHSGMVINAMSGLTMKMMQAAGIWMAVIFVSLQMANAQLSTRFKSLGALTSGSPNTGPYMALPEQVFTSGTNAYVISSVDNALNIFDISSPGAPVFKSSLLNGTGGARLATPMSIFVSGNYAFIASQGNNALEIVDVSNPTTPVHKSFVTIDMSAGLQGTIISVFVSGNYAYITDGFRNLLTIVDITSISQPIVKGVIKDGDGGAKLSGPRSLYVVGNYAYVACSSGNALEIIDISNPVSPVHKSSLSDGVGGALLKYPLSVAISGNYAFVASSQSDALEVVSISDPASPTHAGSLIWGTGGAVIKNPFWVTISSNFAYVTGPQGYLDVIDISNPVSPVHKGSISDGTGGAKLYYPQSVSISGNYAFIANNVTPAALEIVNVTNPLAPVHAAVVLNPSAGAAINYPSSLTVSGQVAYMTSPNSSALEIADVSTPGNPTHLASVTKGSFGGAQVEVPTSVAVQGNYAFVVGYNSKLEVLDISSPATPVHKSSLPLNNGSATSLAQNIFVSGGMAYVVSWSSNSLEIIDVSNPSLCVSKSILHDGDGGAVLNSPSEVFVAANYAYVTSSSNNALEIVNISNPANPVHTGFLGGGVLNFPTSLTVQGNYAYVIDLGGLEVINISNPATPTFVSRTQLGTFLSFGSRVWASGKSIFVTVTGTDATGGNALMKFDVTNPASPVLTGKLTDGSGLGLLNHPSPLFVTADIIYVGTSSSLSVFTYCPIVPQVTLTLTQPTCTVATGAISVVNSNPTDLVSFDNGANYQVGTLASGLNPGAYQVRLSNSYGCASDGVNAQILPQPPKPALPVPINQANPSCSVPTGTVTFVVQNPSDTYSVDGISFQSGSVITGISPGPHQLFIKNSFGCLSDPSPITISAGPPIPDKPVIALTNSSLTSVELTSSTGASYQWFLNGVAIPNATNKTLTATLSGAYTVQTSNGQCPSLMSDGQTIVITGLEETNSSLIQIYPNPVSKIITINLGGMEKNQPLTIQILDFAGRIKESLIGEAGSSVLVDTDTYAGGVYLVRIIQGQTNFSSRFIKI